MRAVLIYLLILVCDQSIAQVSFKNTRLTKPDSNLLFVDVDNWITVENLNLRDLELVAASGSSVSKFDGNRFLVAPKRQGYDVFKLYSGKKLITQKRYIVDTLGTFVVQLGNIKSDVASVNEILANRGLLCLNTNNLFISSLHVISFKTTGLTNGIDTLFRPIPADRGFISSEQEVVIRKLRNSNRLVFHDIIVLGPGLKARMMNPLILTIK